MPTNQREVPGDPIVCSPCGGTRERGGRYNGHCFCVSNDGCCFCRQSLESCRISPPSTEGFSNHIRVIPTPTQLSGQASPRYWINRLRRNAEAEQPRTDDEAYYRGRQYTVTPSVYYSPTIEEMTRWQAQLLEAGLSTAIAATTQAPELEFNDDGSDELKD